MPTVKAGPISADRLKSFIERIEKLEEERKAIGDDIREVYSEAKGVGYDVKTMRLIVAERRKDPADRDEQEALLDVYRHALAQASYRDVAEQFGISKSKVHRLVPRKNRGTDDHATTAGDKRPAGEELGLDDEGPSAPALAPNAAPPGISDSVEAHVVPQPEPDGGVGSGIPPALSHFDQGTPTSEVHRASNEPATLPVPDDIGIMPGFLDRRVSA